MKTTLLVLLVIFTLGCEDSKRKEKFERVPPKTEYIMLQDVRLQYEAKEWRVYKNGLGQIRYYHYQRGQWVRETPPAVSMMQGIEKALNKYQPRN